MIYETKKAKPYSDCIDLISIDSFDSYLYRIMYNPNKTYLQADCFSLCYQQMTIENCNCYVSTFNKLNGTIPCLT